jgi:protein-S-isoprenylcysteine O-methyltransferase Ste14
MSITLLVLYGGKVLVGYKRGAPVDDEEYFQYYANVVLPGSWLVIFSLFIVSLYIPIVISVWFWIGLALMIVGNTFVIGSLWQFAHSEERYLIRSGLFRISRNPMYFGLNASILGMVFMTGFVVNFTNVLFYCMVIIWFVLAHNLIHSEEVFLKMRHQERYQKYQNQVARYLSLYSIFGRE